MELGCVLDRVVKLHFLYFRVQFNQFHEALGLGCFLQKLLQTSLDVRHLLKALEQEKEYLLLEVWGLAVCD